MILRRRSHRNQGFTLIELLVAIGLFALFTLTLTRLMLGGMQTFQRGQAISTIRAELRSAMDLIAADFRQASVIFDPDPKAGVEKSTVLTFRRYTRAASGAVTEVPITYVIDYKGNNTLTRHDLTTDQKVLVAENILVGAHFGEDESSSLYRSYFYWAVNPGMTADTNRTFLTLEVRLTGLKYQGRQEQRLSMVTRISQRAEYRSALASKVSLANPSDVGRPPLWKALLPSSGQGW